VFIAVEKECLGRNARHCVQAASLLLTNCVRLPIVAKIEPSTSSSSITKPNSLRDWSAGQPLPSSQTPGLPRVMENLDRSSPDSGEC
jgi:hypothetical protein